MSINRGQEEPSQDEPISTSDLWIYSDLSRLSWTYIHVIGCFCSVDQGAHEKANKNCEEVEVELWIFGWIFPGPRHLFEQKNTTGAGPLNRDLHHGILV